MAAAGWKKLLEGAPWFRGQGKYPIPAYSEFMPPPRLGVKPYDGSEVSPFAEDDPFGWLVSEYEELLELRPGNHGAVQTHAGPAGLLQGVLPVPEIRGGWRPVTPAGSLVRTNRGSSRFH